MRKLFGLGGPACMQDSVELLAAERKVMAKQGLLGQMTASRLGAQPRFRLVALQPSRKERRAGMAR